MMTNSEGKKVEERGFTLTELMVVISLIVILGALLVGGIMEMRKQAKVRQCASLLQSLIGSIETMKADYSYTRPLGVDKDGNILPLIDLQKIDMGKELNPKSALWKPPLDPDTDVLLNKRLKTYYEIHSSQVMDGNFVDPFGNEIRYDIEQIDMDIDNNGNMEHYIEESLVSAGIDGAYDTDDDIVQKFPKRIFMGEDTP